MITKIRIRRFRSIDDLTINCGRLTILVGPNDAGKSNIVRALNLFFNGETDPGEPFNFQKDFNKFSFVRKKVAKQVEIEITFTLPTNFSGGKKHTEVILKKIWRRDGLLLDSAKPKFSSGDAIGSGSKIPKYLSSHMLEYVPAIKDAKFFENLLGKIYDTLASTSSKGTGIDIATNLKRSTKNLTDNLNSTLNDEFAIDLPENLRSIFENLTIKNARGIPLDRRGDGIKIRHIPELLNFIGNQIDKGRGGRGVIKTTHLWAFEEPENNLEINASFEMVERFRSLLKERKNLQIFMTTHSPVFYEMQASNNKNDTSRYYVNIDKRKNSQSQHTSISLMESDELHEDMGLLPLVADAVKGVREELSKSQKKLNKIQGELTKMQRNGIDFSTPYIFVEGTTDEVVYRRALNLFFPSEVNGLTIRAEENGGSRAAISSLIAWQHFQQHKKNGQTRSVALLDNDESADGATDALPKNFKIKYIQYFKIKAEETLKEIFSQKYSPVRDLESLYSDAFWESAHSKNWLKKAEGSDLFLRLPLDAQNLFWEEDLLWKGLKNTNNPKAARLRIEYEFSKAGKNKAAQYIKRCGDDEARGILAAVEPELEKVIAWLKNDNNQ